MSKNPQHHKRAKHLDVKIHFIRDMIDEKMVDLRKIHIDGDDYGGSTTQI